jgi:hypothetical protein
MVLKKYLLQLVDLRAGSTTVGLGNATILRVYFGATGYSTSSTGTVYVQYNEKVDVQESCCNS